MFDLLKYTMFVLLMIIRLQGTIKFQTLACEIIHTLYHTQSPETLQAVHYTHSLAIPCLIFFSLCFQRFFLHEPVEGSNVI